MWERGFQWRRPDLIKSDASTFIIDGNSLIPPFDSIPSLGTDVANSIVEARKGRGVSFQGGLATTWSCFENIVEYLDALGCLEGMPEANQLSLF